MGCKKIAFFIGFLAVFSFLFSFNMPSAKAMTAAEIQVMIQQLRAQLASLQQKLAEIQGTTTPSWCYTFNVNLKYGDAGRGVEALQIALEKEGLYAKGTSPSHFDELLASAVVGFQEKYSAEILAPLGLKRPTGFVGKTTRAKLNQIYGCPSASVPPVPICVQVITPAQNQATGECRNFPTPCDIPAGWTRIAKCPIPTTPSITVISPNGGERWETGKAYSVRWKILNVPASAYVFVQLVEDIPFSPPSRIFTTASLAQNSVDFTIPFDIKAGSYKAMVEVCVAIDETTTVCDDGRNPWHNVRDKSDAPFSIVVHGVCGAAQGVPSATQPTANLCRVGNVYDQRIGPDSVNWVWGCGTSPHDIVGCWAPISRPSITVLSPNGGERWEIGGVYAIKWSAQGATRVSIDILDEAGKAPFSWDGKIPAVLQNTGNYLWTIPSNALAGKYKIKIGVCPAQISDLDCANEDLSKYAIDSSDNYFSIIAPPVIQHTLTLSKNIMAGGTVTSSPYGINCGTTCSTQSASFASGTTITLTATPATGYTFTGWSGACTGTSATCTVTMNSNQSVTANFVRVQPTTYRLSLSKNIAAGGAITSSPSGINCGTACSTQSASFTADTTVTLTATPATGYTFTGWSGACTGTSTACTVLMDNNKTVTANFTSAAVSTVTIVSPNGGETFVQGIIYQIRWSGGKDKVQIGLASTTSINPLGWINVSASPNSSTHWDGKRVCDLLMSTCWSVSPGSYRILAVSADSVGNYCLDSGCNRDVSNAAFNIVSSTTTTTTPMLADLSSLLASIQAVIDNLWKALQALPR